MKVAIRLIRLMSPFRWWVVLAVLLSFVTVGSSVGLMAVSAYLISKAALATEVAQLTLAVTGVRVFALARAIFRYAERYVTHSATFRILTRLRVWFYEAVEPLAPARLIEHRSGDLLARIMADLETLEGFYVRVVVPPLSAALIVALGTLLLGSFDIWLGVALAGFLILTGFLLPLATRWVSKEPAAGAVSLRAELTALLVDQVLGLADLQVFGQAGAYQRRVMELNVALNQRQERLAAIRGLANGLTALFTGLAALTVLWIAIPLVSGGELTGLYLALLPLTAIACFEAVAPLAQSMQHLESSLVSARRLFDLIDAAPAVVDPQRPGPMPEEHDINVKDLWFSYKPGDPAVLNGLSFTISSGGKAALVGASGSGKTTLVNLLLRFWEYADGEIWVGGQELRSLRATDVRRMIGLVPQHPYLFNSTIRDNLLLAKPDAEDADLIRACQAAQLHDFIAGLPASYYTRVGEDGLTLSGGQRQRLAIARVILKGAPILIMDEATSHLDALTRDRILAGMRRFMEGRTTLSISHLGDTGNFDEIVTLNGEQVPQPDEFDLAPEA